MVHQLCTGSLTVKKFAALCRDFPSIMEHATDFQKFLRQKILGEQTWIRYAVTRREICGAEAHEIRSFLVRENTVLLHSLAYPLYRLGVDDALRRAELALPHPSHLISPPFLLSSLQYSVFNLNALRQIENIKYGKGNACTPLMQDDRPRSLHVM